MTYFTDGPPLSPPEDALTVVPWPVACCECGHWHDAGTTVRVTAAGYVCVADCGGAA